MWNARLDEAQVGTKISGRNINNLRYADDTTLTAESEEELKSQLMKVKEESEKAGLKCSIQKTKIMASGPIAAGKSLLSCPTLCDPTDGSPPGSAAPGTLQARTLEWVAISFSNAWKWKVKVKSLSCVRLFATPWTAAHQVPPFMGFSKQEYWSGLPLPSPVWSHYFKANRWGNSGNSDRLYFLGLQNHFRWWLQPWN